MHDMQKIFILIQYLYTLTSLSTHYIISYNCWLKKLILYHQLCNKHSKRITLAPNQTAHYLQTVYHDALCCLWSCTCLHQWHGCLCCWFARTWTFEKLRSAASGTFDVPRVQTHYGSQAFSVAGPRAWNALPADFRIGVATRDVFKKNLKTLLFNEAYPVTRQN